VIRRSDSSDIRLTTDAKGTLSWKTGEADYYLIRIELEDENTGQEYEATMTFIVQEN
jgi:hypothetical protein